MSDILFKIKEMKREDVFTTKEKIVAEYVLENPEEIIDLTLRDLASATQTSTGTVLRLIKKDLNFSGYSEFKNKLIQELSSNTYRIDSSFIENYSDNLYKNILSLGMNSAYNNLESLIDFKANEEKLDILNVLYEEFFETAYNIIIFDWEGEFGGLLNKTLREQNYSSSYVSSLRRTKKKIINSKNILNKERKKLSKILDDYGSLSAINKSEITKRTFRNNLLILISIDNYISRVEESVELAKENDFTTIIIFSENTKHLLDEKKYDFSINIGKQLDYNLDDEIKEKITYYLFLEYMKIFFANEISKK